MDVFELISFVGDSVDVERCISVSLNGIMDSRNVLRCWMLQIAGCTCFGPSRIDR